MSEDTTGLTNFRKGLSVIFFATATVRQKSTRCYANSAAIE